MRVTLLGGLGGEVTCPNLNIPVAKAVCMSNGRSRYVAPICVAQGTSSGGVRLLKLRKKKGQMIRSPPESRDVFEVH